MSALTWAHWALAIMPIQILVCAGFFWGLQRSKAAVTGGQISFVKSMWLSYAVLGWFLLPLFYLALPGLGDAARVFLILHLMSWWLRGPIELIMIFKLFNWSPQYGIAHDLIHLFLILGSLVYWQPSISLLFSGTADGLVLAFLLVTIVTTIGEALFALKFWQIRSGAEAKDNLYFASNSSKWKAVNRMTAAFVGVAMGHLVVQAIAVVL